MTCRNRTELVKSHGPPQGLRFLASADSDSPAGFLRISAGVVLPVAAATAAITVFLVGSIVRAHRRRPLTGSEGLLGGEAFAHEGFAQQGGRYTGTVWTHGEFWKAQSSTPVDAGQPLRVRDRAGMKLIVEPSNE